MIALPSTIKNRICRRSIDIYRSISQVSRNPKYISKNVNVMFSPQCNRYNFNAFYANVRSFKTGDGKTKHAEGDDDSAARFHFVTSADDVLELQRKSNSSLGLARFTSKVYTKQALGVTSTLAMSLILMPSADTYFIHHFFSGLVVVFPSMIGIHAIKPKKDTYIEDGELIYFTQNPPLRQLAFVGVSVGSGLTLSPFMHVLTQFDPAILPISIFISAVIFGTGAVYSRQCIDDRNLVWKAPIAIGVASLLMIQSAGMFSLAIFGPNQFVVFVNHIQVYCGIMIFTIMSISDANKARQMYENQNADHLGCAVEVFTHLFDNFIMSVQNIRKSR